MRVGRVVDARGEGKITVTEAERMGTTGYWFGKEYTGARAVWTDSTTQVRFGYGDFPFSTCE